MAKKNYFLLFFGRPLLLPPIYSDVPRLCISIDPLVYAGFHSEIFVCLIIALTTILSFSGKDSRYVMSYITLLHMNDVTFSYTFGI